MTDPTDPTDELDELDALASDHLDGHTTEAEAARIAADPVLAARVASLEAARAALRAEVPVDGAARTAAIAAALDAFDAAGVQERSTGLAPVTMPAGGRAPSRRALQLVAIAAALVLLALAVPLLSSLDRSDDDDGDEAATALDADTFGEAEAGGDLESSAPPAPSVAEDSATDGAAQAYNADSPVELGAFPDVDALRDAVRAAAPAPTSRAVPSTTAADDPGRAGTADESLSASPCAEEVAARAPTFSARATVEGRDVLALVQVTAAGTAELVVLDAATCSVVTSRPL